MAPEVKRKGPENIRPFGNDAVAAVIAAGAALLLEDGGYLLLEDGGKLLVE